jgi:predicted transcriptional regulator
MEISLNAELHKKLARIAHRTGRTVNSLVQEAVERLIDHEEWFLRKVEAGLAAADRGELIEHEEIGKLIDRRYPGSAGS